MQATRQACVAVFVAPWGARRVVKKSREVRALWGKDRSRAIARRRADMIRADASRIARVPTN
jgi:hypothetical protein